jgi:hypothetical protein
MMIRRRWRKNLKSATAVAVLVLCAASAFLFLGQKVAAQNTVTTSATEVVPPPVAVGTVTVAPPTTGPVVGVGETSPTVPPAIEGPLLPIETGVAPVREIDEGAALNIFADPAVAQKLLFGGKKFLYDAKGRPDPMVIPWVRTEIVLRERINQAQAYIKKADGAQDVETKRSLYIQALEEFDQVVKADPTSILGKDARVQSEKIRALLDKLPPKGVVLTPTPTKPPELPPWIPANTKAILFDQSPKHDHRVLVGDEVLRVGSAVSKYPEAKIIEISREAVVYEYMKTRFNIKVEIELTRE